MLTILGIIIGFAIGITELIDWHEDIADWITGIVTAFESAVLVGLIGLVLSVLVGICFTVETPEVEVIKKPIYALQDNFTTTGAYARTIFYGRGYIEQDLSYYFIADTDKGRKVTHTKAENTYLNFIPKETEPFVEYHYKKTEIKNEIAKFLCAPFTGEEIKEDYYVLNIPANSMATEMSIDLK